MQKVNVKFHDNFTVSYQHKKILEFVPELSIDKNTQIITPNIPLLVSIRIMKKRNIKPINIYELAITLQFVWNVPSPLFQPQLFFPRLCKII